MCVCVCVYIYIYIYTHTHTYIHKYIYIYIYIWPENAFTLCANDMANTQVSNMEGDTYTGYQTHTGLTNKVIHLLEDIKT